MLAVVVDSMATVTGQPPLVLVSTCPLVIQSGHGVCVAKMSALGKFVPEHRQTTLRLGLGRFDRATRPSVRRAGSLAL